MLALPSVTPASRSGIRRLGAGPLVLAAIITMGIAGCSEPPLPDESRTETAPTDNVSRPVEADVRAAQTGLAALGYYKGSIDGIAGPKTHAAITDFQTDHGLPPDGEVSKSLLAQIRKAQPAAASVEPVSDPGPMYEAGDVYEYTDGQIETVDSLSRRQIQWHDGKGRHWTTEIDFTLPSFEDADGLIAKRPLSWPLHVGAVSNYTTSADGEWRCDVEGRETVSVAAGTFDGYKIVCRPGRADPAAVTNSRTWYYAPAVGHYVRYIDSSADPLNGITRTRSRDLVGVSPGAADWPSEAKTGLQWAVSHTLEVEPPGRKVEWQSTAVAARFVVEAGGPVLVRDKAQCRRFSQTRIPAKGPPRQYPGIACRDEGGGWRLLGSGEKLG